MKKKIDIPRGKFFKLLPARIVIGRTPVGAAGSCLVFKVWMKLRLPKGLRGI